MNTAMPRSPDFTPAPGFELGDFATREVWEYAIHAPRPCTVQLDAPVSPEARASFGPRAVLHEEEGGVRVALVVTNGEGLVRHVLSLGERARIVSPATLRNRGRAILSGLAKRVS